MLAKSVENIVAETGMSDEAARASLAKINPQNLHSARGAETVIMALQPERGIDNGTGDFRFRRKYEHEQV